MRYLSSLVLTLCLIASRAAPLQPAAAASCQFVLGFKTIHDQMPSIVGDCLVDEHHNTENGDGLQETTGPTGAGGLLVWRKADNWTAYTDGYRSWVNGPNGLRQRLNSQRFGWEANPDGLPVVGATGSPGALSTGGPMTGLHVAGHQILNSADHPVQLHGVNRSSFEYMCISGDGISEGPMNQAEADAMKAWHINAVRVVLNEDCWLGLHGVNPAYSGSTYQNAVARYVALLTNNNLAVILNLHFNGDGNSLAGDQEPLADRAHSPAFWTSVAQRFRDNSAVIFEPYNEPHDVTWTCWRDGGTCAGVSFPVAGMQEMVDAIRATGATNIIIATGTNWGSNLDQWLQYQPTDPLHQLAAGWHSYHDGLSCQDAACWTTTLASLLTTTPLVATEIGELDCAHTYIDLVMSFLERNGQSYTAWAWTPNGGCATEPALLTDWNGTPSQTFGQGFKDHLLTKFP